MEDKARERAKQPEVTEASAGCFSGWGHSDGEVVGFRDMGEGGRQSQRAGWDRRHMLSFVTAKPLYRLGKLGSPKRLKP